ncbi:MAG: tail fiber domain-containing protein [Bacteroidales bacterium]
MRSIKLLRIVILIVNVLVFSPVVLSQGVLIQESTKDKGEKVDPSAVLEVRSTEKGLLIPSMTSLQREAIVSPANGLMVFDTDKACFYYYDATKEGKAAWVKTVSGDANIGPGTAGKVAYFQDATTISAHSSVELSNSAEEPIFVVKNSEGQTVFAVYEKGVRIYVDSDTVSTGKTARGGFAVGGFTTGKADLDFLKVTPDSVRIFINADSTKTARGGFAVGGFTTTKGFQELLRVTQDSTRIYIDDSPGKTARGGFAVGGFTAAKKGAVNEFFNVETVADEQMIITPSEPRVLWHPLKNAFLAGQVLIENPQDIGMNSLSIGFETKASGNRSQALGFESMAIGDYSTAIGRNALAESINSFAFGDSATASGDDAFAFGTHSIAQGSGSYAFGSLGRDSLNNVIEGSQTLAAGSNSFAFGLGSVASGNGAFALGSGVNAAGPNSVAMGFGTMAQNQGSYAIGWGANAQGMLSFSSGFYTQAEGEGAVAMGDMTRAQGNYSVALGSRTVAYSSYETVVGNINSPYVPLEPYGWNPQDRLFVIGNANANEPGFGSNALTILKNGSIGLQDVENPIFALQLPNNVMDNVGNAMATNWFTYSDKRIKSDIKDMEYGLKEILKLKPLSYLHHNSTVEDKDIKIDENGSITLGLIAQDVYKIIPEIVSKPQNDEKELWGLSYEKLVPVLVKAIQEQQQIIDKQNEVNEDLKARIERLEKLLLE